MTYYECCYHCSPECTGLWRPHEVPCRRRTQGVQCYIGTRVKEEVDSGR